MAKKSVVSEAQEIQLAIELIQLGARLQLLETEVSLSRERLLNLYNPSRPLRMPPSLPNPPNPWPLLHTLCAN